MQQISKSRINGAFSGFNSDMLYKLDNGEVWMQAKYKYKYKYKYRPFVNILKEYGKFYLQVEGMDETVEVKKINDYIESCIVNDFRGWSGETTFELQNGQVWRQNSYSYRYHYAFRPNAIIYNTGCEYKLKVEGVEECISVVRIK